MPLSIFRLRQLRTANLIVVLMYAALFSMFFFITLYLQQVLRDDADPGGALVPADDAVGVRRLDAGAAAGGPVRGPRHGDAPGCSLASAGLLLFTGVRPGGDYFALVLPGAMLAGLGMGLGLVGSTIAATQGVQRAPSRAGVRAAEHLAAVRRCARPGGAEHDRRARTRAAPA